MLPAHTSERYEVIVVTDADRVGLRGTRCATNNNRSVDDAADLGDGAAAARPCRSLSITGPDVVDAGGTASVDFVVINQGPVATNVPIWNDRVYLSLDDKITPRRHPRARRLSNAAALGPGERVPVAAEPVPGPGALPRRRLRRSSRPISARPSTSGRTRSNNVKAVPDLRQPVAVRRPRRAATWWRRRRRSRAHEVEVRYTVTNLGSGATDRGAWTEQVWLTHGQEPRRTPARATTCSRRSTLRRRRARAQRGLRPHRSP